jgi:methionine biosynthesis protein MetW
MTPEWIADGAVFYRIDPRSSVMDLGCDDEKLLFILAREKSVRAQSIKEDHEAIYAFVTKEPSVIKTSMTRLQRLPPRLS